MATTVSLSVLMTDKSPSLPLLTKTYSRVAVTESGSAPPTAGMSSSFRPERKPRFWFWCVLFGLRGRTVDTEKDSVCWGPQGRDCHFDSINGRRTQIGKGQSLEAVSAGRLGSKPGSQAYSYIPTLATERLLSIGRQRDSIRIPAGGYAVDCLAGFQVDKNTVWKLIWSTA